MTSPKSAPTPEIVVAAMIDGIRQCDVDLDELAAAGRVKLDSGAWYKILDSTLLPTLARIASGAATEDPAKLKLSKIDLRKRRGAL